MNFLDEIKKYEEERNNHEDLVINEIVSYFQEKIDSDSFLNTLKERIKYKIDESQHTLDLVIEYHRYSAGCGNTYFSVVGFKFELPYEKYDYKGIDLYDIQDKVGNKLNDLLENKIVDLGLTIRVNNLVCTNNYKRIIKITW